MAQPRCELAAEPRSVRMVVLMTMVVYATWAIMSLIHNYMMQIFT